MDSRSQNNSETHHLHGLLLLFVLPNDQYQLTLSFICAWAARQNLVGVFAILVLALRLPLLLLLGCALPRRYLETQVILAHEGVDTGNADAYAESF